MEPSVIASLVAGATQGIGGLFNSIGTNRQNFASRQFSREMYNKTRNDNLEFWAMQNEYNSPQAQMQRLQEAGLNPALMYGSGAAGGNAGSIPTPETQSAQFRNPEWGTGISAAGLTGINAMYDLEMKGAQTDNLRAQNQVIVADAALRAAQTANTLQSTERGIFDLDLDKDTRAISAEARKEALRQLKTNTDLSINRDAREAAINSSNLQEAFQRMLSIQEQRANTIEERNRIRAQKQNIQLDSELKRLDIQLRKKGINPNDPMWSRIVGRVVDEYFKTGGDIKKAKYNMWQLFNFLSPNSIVK